MMIFTYSLHLHRELTSLESSLPSKKKELTKIQSELKVLSDAAEKLSAQLKDSSGHVEEAKSSLAAQNERGKVLSALLRQKESGALPGICGRLVSVCVRVEGGLYISFAELTLLHYNAFFEGSHLLGIVLKLTACMPTMKLAIVRNFCDC